MVSSCMKRIQELPGHTGCGGRIGFEDVPFIAEYNSVTEKGRAARFNFVSAEASKTIVINFSALSPFGTEGQSPRPSKHERLSVHSIIQWQMKRHPSA